MKIRKMWVAAFTAALAVGVLGLAGCGTQGAEAPTQGAQEEPAAELTGSITVGGSDTMVNMGQALAEAFMDANPGVDISVTGGGTGTGIAALINGTIDFANASRPMDEEEMNEAAATHGAPPVEYTVAYDGIAIVVNPALGLDSLSFEQLGAIYRGEITNWSEVGGPDKEIVALSRDAASGTYEFFLELVVQAEDENAVFAPTTRLMPSTQGIVDEVVANDGAIGYIGLGYVTADTVVVAIDGVAASVEAVRGETYPISRPLFTYAAVEPSGAAREFIDWVLSPAGQAIVADVGFVPLD